MSCAGECFGMHVGDSRQGGKAEPDSGLRVSTLKAALTVYHDRYLVSSKCPLITKHSHFVARSTA